MSAINQPTGHVPVPLLIFGTVSLMLGMIAEVAGVFLGPVAYLREAWEAQGLVIEAEMGLPDLTGLLVTAGASFGLVAAILGTPGLARRMVLGATAVLLSLGLIPSLAVWGIFWNPFGMLLSVGWAWFSASVYAQTHRMPCEASESGEAENVIRFGDGSGTEGKANRSHGPS